MTENKGRFKKGNRASVRPKLCPYCGEEVAIGSYIYLRKRKEPQAD